MTIENLLYRFIKENGLYPHVKKHIGWINIISKRRPNFLLSSITINQTFFNKDGLKSLFYNTFCYNSLFSGDHNSPQRRKFYKLNKKWKDFVDGKFFLQSNIEIGDNVTFKNMWGTPRKGRIIKMDSVRLLIKEDGVGYETWRPITSISEISEKELKINLFYKDETGNEYGKIDGFYNEIQL